MLYNLPIVSASVLRGQGPAEAAMESWPAWRRTRGVEWGSCLAQTSSRAESTTQILHRQAGCCCAAVFRKLLLGAYDSWSTVANGGPAASPQQDTQYGSPSCSQHSFCGCVVHHRVSPTADARSEGPSM